MYLGVLPTCMYVYLCAGLMEARERYQIPSKFQLQAVVRPLTVMLGTISGPLEGQEACLTTEPSFQPEIKTLRLSATRKEHYLRNSKCGRLFTAK